MNPRPFRPTSITTLAIINLVFAGLGALGLVFTYAMYFGGMELGPRNPVVEIAHRSPEYMTFLRWSMLTGGLGIAALFASGLGLLKMRIWARKIAITYALFAMVSGIVGMIVTQHYVIGPLSHSHEQAASMGAMGGYMGGILGLAYPIILLVFMFKRSVVAALQVANEQQIPPARIV